MDATKNRISRRAIHAAHSDMGALRGIIWQLNELFRFRYVIQVYLKNRITDRYHGSVLGIAWSLFNPLLSMLGFALVLPLIMKFKVPDYIIYLLSGVAVWCFISGSISAGSESIISNRFLFQKVYIPKPMFPFVVVSADLLNLIITLVAFHIIGFAFGLNLSTNILYLFIAVVLTYVFCLGLAFIASAMIVYFRDSRHIIGVVLQFIFYVSAIIYPASMIPEKYLILLEINPFYQFIRLFHISLYPHIDPDTGYLLIPAALAIGTLLLGTYVQYKAGKSIIYRL